MKLTPEAQNAIEMMSENLTVVGKNFGMEESSSWFRRYLARKARSNQQPASYQAKCYFKRGVEKAIATTSYKKPIIFRYGMKNTPYNELFNDNIRLVFDKLPKLPEGKFYALPPGTQVVFQKERYEVVLKSPCWWL